MNKCSPEKTYYEFLLLWYRSMRKEAQDRDNWKLKRSK